ncbi:MAG: hypothetical protein BGO77_06170 [Caedibacter sp. 37-49]|nr:MAG: hypothetical protein BGO77_06170 [Caedibacter sp. 37-49]
MTQKLTKRFADNIQPNPHQELLLWDNAIKGFGLRVFSSGRKTYFVQYRNDFNRTRRMKVGVHGIITAEQAREEAKIILGEVAKGHDPSSESKNKKQVPTFIEFSNEYLELYAKGVKREKSYKEDQKLLIIIFKYLGTKNIQEITTKDIHLLHRALKETPYQANRVRALLSKMFSLSMQWGWRTDNPAKGVENYQEHKRDRWLNDNEVQRLWKVLDTYSNQDIANVVRLLLLTGARRSEVLTATWDQFNLEQSIWTKPAHATKQKRMEHLPLSPQATEILKKIQQAAHSNFLFPGKIPGKPLQEIKKAWDTIRKRAGLSDVRLHDLRHTHASHLVSSGLSLSIVGKLLGHTQASTTQRYAHLADEPLRQATSLFGNKIESLTSDTSTI